MRTIVDQQILQKSPLFVGVDEGFIQSVLPVMQRETLPRGYLINSGAEFHDRFHILLNGRVKVGRHHADSGREMTLFLLGPGDGFNILSVLDQADRHDLQMRTLDKVEILWVSVERWMAWMEESAALRTATANVAATMIQHLCELASELALDSTMTRLVRLLLRHIDTPDLEFNLIHHLSQEELANMIGTVRPVIARLLSELRREGVLELDDGTLHITDVQRLLERADRDLIPQ
ncbi:MAG: helix-turn-helix domain-containing protein [Gammaproteobacteria bacterium]|nr:helix-turn-helix domain-containing protein [Gammaproteobacteria bacterium]